MTEPQFTPRHVSRRSWLAGLGAAGLGAAVADLSIPFITSAETRAVKPANPIRIGSNFSPLEAEYLEMDTLETLNEVLQLPLDFLRIGAYWNQLEPEEGRFDFSSLDTVLEAIDRRGIPVILTIGIKAPVWPEFHFPWWVHESTPLPPTGLVTRSQRLRELGNRFAREVARRYATASNIFMLQVENEPFEPIIPVNWWSLDEDFVQDQIEIVRAEDRLNRPILLTSYVASNPLVSGMQGMLKRPTGKLVTDPIFGVRPESALIDMADVVGLDVYPGMGWSFFGYPEYFFADRDEDFNPLLAARDAVMTAGKKVMIAECQAKPWEPGEKVFRGTESPSFRPENTAKLVERMYSFGFDEIALWGIEHWIWHRKYGDAAWWYEGSKMLENRSKISG